MRFKNYRNPYTNDNKIYSFKDLYDMPFGELIRKKQEVLGQYRVLGVPRDEELQSSENVVHVEAYTREDGTEVKAHYRSKPGGGSSQTDDGTSTGGASEVNEPIQEKQEAQPDENIQEQNQDNKEQTEQAEKEMDERLYPEEVAGVKRGEPMSKTEAGGKNVNPNYDTDDIGYKLNCSYCSAIYRARRDGYNIEALPARDTDGQEAKLLRKYPYFAYQKSDGSNMERPSKYRSTNQEECLKNIESKVGKGEEYIFWYQPKGGTIGLAHVVEISRNNNGELEFYDSQNGETQGKEYIQKVDFMKKSDKQIIYYPQYLFRVDDKVVKPKVLNKIARPSQRVPI